MKSYIEITKKYLKVQKKRSILTAVGIILSTALITGIGTIYTSMFDANLRATIRDNGDYYAAVTDVPGDKIDRLLRNAETEKSGAAKSLGFAVFDDNEPGDTNPPHKYLHVQAMDGGAMSMLPYALQEGRMPAAEGEIVLDYWALKYMDGIGLGDKIVLNLGTRALPDGAVLEDTSRFDPGETFTPTGTAEYTVVGLLRPAYVSTTNFAGAIAYLDPDRLTQAETYTAYLKLNSTSNIQERIRQMVSAAGIDAETGAEGAPAIKFNDRLLRLYAQSVNEALNDSVMVMLGVVTSLVVLATIAVIYNAFNISVVERVSQFGLLRCVGATPRQIRNIVFREALLLGAVGIPIGVLCGTAAMGVVFRVVSLIAPDMILGGLRLVVSPGLVVFSTILGAFTIYLSALLPARKAAKISPMEAVRGAGVLRKEKYRATDRHRLSLLLFGAEGWLAWKNLGRNRKRFYITTFSMVVSIVLFIVFSSLVTFAYDSGAVGSGDVPSYLIWPIRSQSRIELKDEEYAALRRMEGVDYALRCGDASGEVTLPRAALAEKAAGLLPETLLQPDASGKIKLVNSMLFCYGDESTDTILQKLQLNDADREAFLKGEGAILVNGASLYDSANKRGVLTNMTNLRLGDTVSFSAFDAESEEGGMLAARELKVLAVVDDGLAGAMRNENGGVNLIGSEALYAAATGGSPFPTSVMIMMRNNADRTQVKAWLDNEIDPLYNIIDYDEAAKSMKQVWTVLGIFLYGFVAVISLIGCLNIINTISTNIIVRTRELSVMRAIGMFEGGIRRMIAWESMLHSAAAALLGSVVGTALSWLIYNGMSGVREFPWALPWQQILIAVGAAALVAVVSGFVPLRRIGRGVIVEGIRGEE